MPENKESLAEGRKGVIERLLESCKKAQLQKEELCWLNPQGGLETGGYLFYLGEYLGVWYLFLRNPDQAGDEERLAALLQSALNLPNLTPPLPDVALVKVTETPTGKIRGELVGVFPRSAGSS